MFGRNNQFVAKAENKGKETQGKQRKRHYLRYEGRCIVSTKGKNWQYKAEFVQNGSYVSCISELILQQEQSVVASKYCRVPFISRLSWSDIVLLFTATKFRVN
jgi:hypothetical protein